jgi:hypothetical protein
MDRDRHIVLKYSVICGVVCALRIVRDVAATVVHRVL